MSNSSDPQPLSIQQATFDFEQATLKPLIYLNGGAIVAALTYVGHEKSFTYLATFSIVAWVGGLAFSVAALCAGYWSRYSFLKGAQKSGGAAKAEKSGDKTTQTEERKLKQKWNKRGRHTRILVWILCLLSLVGFIAGSTCGILFLAEMV